MRFYLLLALLFAATGFFVVLRLDQTKSSLVSLTDLELVLVLPSLLAFALGVLGFGLVWAAIVRLLGREGPPIDDLLRFFLLTWPARYIPGTIAYHATRVLMAERVGASKRRLATSIAYETVLSVAAAALLGIFGMLLSLGIGQSDGAIYVLAILPLAVLPLALHPRILIPVASRILRLAKRATLSPEIVLTGRQTTAVCLAYAVVHTLNGAGFYFVLLAVTDTPINPALAVGVYSLAAAVGVAVIFVPSGIGVREGVIVALMSSVITPEAALLAAGATRAISTLADLVPLALLAIQQLASGSLRRVQSRRGSRGPSTAVIQRK
jgi:uncharacterized membrane protein YbhN (UPF0104 family)